MPFIREINREVLEFINRDQLPNPGSWRDQPIWFNRLWVAAKNEMNRLEQVKAEKLSKKKR